MWDESVQQKLDRLLAGLFGDNADCLLSDLPGSAEACLSWGLARARHGTVVWIGDGPRTLDSALRDLQSLAPPESVPLLHFPAWESLPDETGKATPDPDIAGARLAALIRLAERKPAVIATCVQALLQPVLSPAALIMRTLTLAAGQEQSLESAIRTLEGFAYRFGPQVQERGEASVRGGLLDVRPLSEEWPLRLEFTGSVIESIRAFDPVDQRSRDRRARILLTPAGEGRPRTEEPETSASLLAYLPADTVFVWSDLAAIEHYADIHETTLAAAPGHRSSFEFPVLRRQIDERSGTRQLFLGSGPPHLIAPHPLDFKAVPSLSTMGRNALPPDAIQAARQHLLQELSARAGRGQSVFLYFDTPGALARYEESPLPAAGQDRIHTLVRPISTGFMSEELGLVVVAESDLYGRRTPRRRRLPLAAAGPEQGLGARVTDWTDMEPGDLVVHLEHGIGRYLGLREITDSNGVQEVLAIEYAEKARLYVPVSQAHLLTRYVGVGKRFTGLHNLSGKRWEREKIAAEKSIQDMAAQLLETQAARETLAGHAFRSDTPWQHEFEAAFPYEETRDQEQAIGAVKQDMERSRPMDRLICGDAGYGKTEVALRAAFKTVMDARQVAVLVPTTVLAQQHFNTFTERMAAFPMTIEMLCRFITRTQHDRVLEGLRDGTVDIVVGTHGLLQPGVQFRDLGLVIVDEEQRFGVAHKERFKQIRRLVDVLTLTATPIPRTLYMSLTGARDLSTIQTPPQDRLAVETIVARDTDEVIREAILRELNREGQVYYLHNRVMTIDRILARLRAIVPEAQYEVAHGQMAANQLADVMQRFVAGEIDVLVCTTIVESGMDIPNANTILIDRADRFGLAELYQLRGRVGRSHHKAYAYMLLPGHAAIDPTARKRIQAVSEHSDLGAGFRLAMRDLEIRGAGNLLGSEQSGHITAVGFGLYCQLLKRTVAQKRGEPLPPVVDVDLRLDFIDLSPASAAADNSALIPITYIEEERLRVSMYRKIAEAARMEDVVALREEFRDRFGKPPQAVMRLLTLTQIRVAAAARDIGAIEVREDKVMCQRKGQYLMTNGRFPRLRKKRPDDRLAEILTVLKKM